MSTINIKCVDQVLTCDDMPVISSGDKNIDEVQFNFCPLWDGFIKVAVFFHERDKVAYEMVGANNKCSIPNSILEKDGIIYIGVAGFNANDQTRTSNLLNYTIVEGAVAIELSEGYPGTEEESKEFFNKILNMYAEMQVLHNDALNNMAYVHVNDANLFEYDESKLEAKIRAYTMPSDQIITRFNEVNTKISSLNSDLISKENTLNSKIDDLSSRLTNEILSVNENIADLGDTINDLVTMINGLDERIRNLGG